MIFSNNYNFVIFSPQKTGTRVRHGYYRPINYFGKSMTNAHSTVWEFNQSHLNRKGLMKFCFVRNPWDRIVSMFHMSFKCNPIHQRRNQFKQFIMDYDMKTMEDFYTIDQKVMVDEVFKMEELYESIKIINSKVKYISNDIKLKKTKLDANYKEWLDQEMIEFIAEKEKYTLKLIDYKFNLN